MKTTFHCTQCDTQFPKWMGQCTECGKWGTIEQEEGGSSGGAPVSGRIAHGQAIADVKVATPVRFADVTSTGAKRVPTGMGECDRVLGGGIVPGALVLLGGDPGIGKSTLVAQMACRVQAPVLYVSGEESAEQVKMRLDRLGLPQDQLQFLAEEHVERICKTLLELKPALVIIDSIQTVASSGVTSEPGSVNQIKASAVRFLETAKSSGIPIIIIGHVTKGGELGGPKTLEHIVDTVLYLEGDKQHQFRILRSVKNRFGSTSEVGVFEMGEQGLQEVPDPSQLFLSERVHQSGSCITAITEGSRVFLVEVQALVSRTAFGFPQRKSSGFDLNRLNVLLAVLAQRGKIPFDEFDVYINTVGGVSVRDHAADLAVCLALVSALRDQALPESLAAWGEIGLGGEVRTVSHETERAKETKRFGITTTVSGKIAKDIRAAMRSAGLK